MHRLSGKNKVQGSAASGPGNHPSLSGSRDAWQAESLGHSATGSFSVADLQPARTGSTLTRRITDSLDDQRLLTATALRDGLASNRLTIPISSDFKLSFPMALSHRPSTSLFKLLHSRTQAGLSLPVLLCLFLFIVSATLLCFLSSPPPPPTPLAVHATSDDPQAGFGWFTGKSGGGVTSAGGHLGKSLGGMVNAGDWKAGDAVPSSQTSRAALLSALYAALGEGEEANPLFFLSTGDFGSGSPSQKAVAAQVRGNGCCSACTAGVLWPQFGFKDFIRTSSQQHYEGTEMGMIFCI